MGTAGLSPMIEEGRTASVEWGAAGAPLASEALSGDLHFVGDFASGSLLAVMDGLGHGPKATAAAKRARDAIEDHAGSDLVHVMRKAHEALKGTRGVALTLAWVDASVSHLSWVGVGNVSGMLLPLSRASYKSALGNRGGVVGYKLPTLVLRTLAIAEGDMIVLATDGIRSGYSNESIGGLPPAKAAAQLLAHFQRKEDDALVLVAKCQVLLT